MKKVFSLIIIILSLNLIFVSDSLAASKTQNAEISKIENNLYGFDYVNDELKNRVARLEKTIYGQESKGDLSSRIKKISSDILAEQIGQEITPREDTFLEDEQTADNTVNYPVVDEIERRLFNTTYPNRDFHTRIVTIERKLFGKIYDVEDYSTRMDRIKTAVMPEALVTDNNRFNYDDNAINSSDLSGLNSNRFSGFMPSGQRRLTRPYTNYGDYSNNTSLNDSSLDVQQHMSTAMEIGAMILMILAMVL